MKKIILIFGVFTLVGCSTSIAEQEEDLKQAKIQAELEATEDQRLMQKYMNEASVVTRDGCQYLVYRSGRYKTSVGFGTHKGDCTNPIHER